MASPLEFLNFLINTFKNLYYFEEMKDTLLNTVAIITWILFYEGL